VVAEWVALQKADYFDRHEQTPDTLYNWMAVWVLMVERLPTHIQLVQIYLLPEYQRLGIGTVLLQKLIAEARQSQIPIRLKVMTINPAKLYL
jgi:GNAT superfamily N-acetyltransferase